MGLAEDAEILVGRFVVRVPLGRGGMGDVFRAHDPYLERDVALKVVDGALESEDPEWVRREARALARLAHPNVVSVYELGIAEGQLFVAMEFVPGRTMREHAQRSPPPTWQELVGLFLQAGMGLIAAHDAGLVHRDVKPENLLVREDGRVLVADFGLARPGDALAEPEISGTPGFLAPEVLRLGLATAKSDQYAFCASLWRLIDPQTPVGGPAPRMARPVLDALRRGLADDPDARWPSMRELVGALRDALDPGPDARHRALLLDRVERLWIAGVLHPALAGRPPIHLTVSDVAAPAAASRGARPPGAPEAPVEASGPALAQLLARSHGALLLLGEPGSGKTVLLLRLAASLLETARLDPTAPAPVVLNLASLGAWAGGFGAWVEHELVAKYNLPRAHVARWVDTGVLVLLLDGLDEVPPDRRASVIGRLGAFRATHGVSLVATCRSSDHDRGESPLGFGLVVEIDPLPGSALASVLPAEADVPAHLRTPLLLGLLHDSPEAPPPGRELMRWLVERHLAHAFVTRAVPSARERRLRAGLGFLAAAMTRAGRSELWLEELDPAWLFDDRRVLLARSLAVALLFAITVSVNMTVSWLAEGDAFSGLVFGLCSAPMVLAFNRGLRSEPVERLRFSPGRLVRLAPLCVGLGMLAGAIYGLFYVVWNNVVFGAAAGLVTLLTISFEPSLREGGVRPNQGMRQSLLNGLAIGALGLVAAALTFGVVVVPAVLPYLDARSTLVSLPHPGRTAAAVAGPMIGVIAGMVQGGWAVLAHAATRIVLAATTPLPLQLVPFLDAAADLALLRRVGGGYIFPHRVFQEVMAGERPP